MTKIGKKNHEKNYLQQGDDFNGPETKSPGCHYWFQSWKCKSQFTRWLLIQTLFQ